MMRSSKQILKVELGFKQILEYIIAGIKNERYQATIDLAQDCINEMSKADTQDNKEKNHADN